MGDRWWTSDPDYGVVYPFPASELAELSREPAVRRTLETRAYPGETIERYLEILQTTHDNVVCPLGLPLSPRLYLVEQACDWLAWLLPGLCSVLASWLWWTHG